MLRLCLVCMALGAGVSTAAAQEAAPADSATTAPVARRVTAALESGDAESLLSPAAERVEISLFGARTFYSRDQAVYVLRDFFAKHPPRQFKVRDVAQTDRSYFVTGQYGHAQADQALRVFVRLNVSGDVWALKEVRVENP